MHLYRFLHGQKQENRIILQYKTSQYSRKMWDCETVSVTLQCSCCCVQPLCCISNSENKNKEDETCFQGVRWVFSSSLIVYCSLQWPWPLQRHAGPIGRKEGCSSWRGPSSAARGDLPWRIWCTDATVDWVVKAGPGTRQTGEAVALITLLFKPDRRKHKSVSGADTWW